MKLVDFREVFLEKIKRQSQVKELEVHAHGHCLHVGRISYGCGWCFAKRELIQLSFGCQCMCRDTCAYCFFGSHFEENNVQPYRHNLGELLDLALPRGGFGTRIEADRLAQDCPKLPGGQPARRFFVPGEQR